jgi:hypothetical protein
MRLDPRQRGNRALRRAHEGVASGGPGVGTVAALGEKLMMPTSDRIDRLAGALLGTAVGDALGLPREGLSRRRAERLYGGGPIQHRFVFGRGMLSDDTEHACMAALALLAAPEDEARFARSLAWRLRGWLAAMPAAVGWGTRPIFGLRWTSTSSE